MDLASACAPRFVSYHGRSRMARPPPGRSVRLAATLLWSACALGGTATAQGTAQSEVSIFKGDQVRISKVDDILIGAFPSSATLDARTFRTDQFDYQCVYSSTGNFGITVSSANGGGRLRLVSAEGQRMNYELHLWFRPTGGSFRYTSTRYPRSPIVLPGLSGSTSPTCADEGLDNSNFIVTGVVDRADFNAAVPGIYQDTVTLLVSPE